MSIMGCANCGQSVDTDYYVDECPYCGKDIFEEEEKDKE